MMQQDDDIGLSADALAALREFAMERGIDVGDDDDDVDVRKGVQSALEEAKGPNDESFCFTFGDDIEIRLNGLRRDIGQTLNSTGLTLWRAGDFLSDFMFRHKSLFEGKRVLEFGSGLGLCGILAGKLGADVLITDGDDESMPVLIDNCKLNGMDPTVCCKQLLWGTELTPETKGCYDVLLGADIIYEKAYVAPLFASASHFLSRRPNHLFLLAYTKRNVSIDYVLECARAEGFQWVAPTTDEGIYHFTFAP
ncbi:hypothetical protein SPRG_12443 [Saprolegnia parasitica CBS 223.65]|uniref:Uncharacterized protein n=1 Tax=Saprolegnia parasitica (strain CBS 223.65) TaxID=695850 RepID=A0A067C4F4_SAPPC|nr:hypothetical protein SPRG_12443 [Saprolegnia parasitica CBS 223.65]KDO21436.1 hypothetical protein SPRG_12443 [Saprolegnia parasitica CBS 223.65]|eukprot:XP_012207882.1 hypothetical protein SPRG_12443 [Saprolegnia parasitica CBS 223.65]